MTTPDHADKLIRAYLAEGPTELPDPSFEVVRGEIDRTRQRPPFFPLAIPTMSDSARLLAVAAVVLIAFVGINLLGQRGDRGVGTPGGSASPPPSASPAASASPASSASPTPTTIPPPSASPTDSATPPPRASPTPSPASSRSPRPLPTSNGTIQAGTYRLTDDFPVPVTVTVPAGWYDCTMGPLEQGVCGRPDGSGVGFMIITNVVANPCGAVGLDPPVGPTTHDLATAIAALAGFQATTPIDVTVDGHPGVELTVTAPSGRTCDLLTWMGPDRTNGVGAGEVNKLRIVDVDGTRVLIAAPFHPTAQAPDIPADIQQVLDSVRFP